tara:strand:- start:110 stop:232 length:123 start_codon:yes stop_codon:yes gene_type:complete
MTEIDPTDIGPIGLDQIARLALSLAKYAVAFCAGFALGAL